MDIKKIIEMLENMEGVQHEDESGFKGYVVEEKPNEIFHNFTYTEVDEFEMDVQKHLDILTKSTNQMKGAFPGLLDDREYIEIAQETLSKSVDRHRRSIRVLREVERRLEHGFNQD